MSFYLEISIQTRRYGQGRMLSRKPTMGTIWRQNTSPPPKQVTTYIPNGNGDEESGFYLVFLSNVLTSGTGGKVNIAILCIIQYAKLETTFNVSTSLPFSYPKYDSPSVDLTQSTYEQRSRHILCAMSVTRSLSRMSHCTNVANVSEVNVWTLLSLSFDVRIATRPFGETPRHMVLVS